MTAHKLFLDIFFDDGVNQAFADRAASDLKVAVERIAPHIDLRIDVKRATDVVPWIFEWQGQTIHAVRHDPSDSGRQAVLITDREIDGAQGWGKCTCAVVSRPRMKQKTASGGAAVDIVIHEWLHTLEGIVINGRPVPFADDAKKLGFVGIRGPDNEDRWEAWYAYALGGSSAGNGTLNPRVA